MGYMDNESFFKEIYSKHKEKLKNIDFVNDRKLVIAFSSIPGSGKTTISKILEEHFNAVRFNGDDVRDIVKELRRDISSEEGTYLKREYFKWFYENIIEQGKNKFIILDFSVDRIYEELRNNLKNLEYEVLLVGLYTPLNILKERIKERNTDGYVDYFNNLDRWKIENEEFRKKYKSNMFFNTENKSTKDISKEIIEFIEKKKSIY